MDKRVVYKIIKWMKGLYGNDMRILRGKKHDQFSMNLDFSVKVQVAVTIVDYLKGVIYDFEEVEVLTGTAAQQHSGTTIRRTPIYD